MIEWKKQYQSGYDVQASTITLFCPRVLVNDKGAGNGHAKSGIRTSMRYSLLYTLPATV